MSEHGVIILRLGYRRGRDPRITTHLALVARALGAQKFLFSGDEDEKMEDNISSVNQRFGGDMEIEHIKSPMAWLRRFVEQGLDGNPPGVAVHLTMYGASFREAVSYTHLTLPTILLV